MKKYFSIKRVALPNVVILIAFLFVFGLKLAHPKEIRESKKMIKLVFVLKVSDESKYKEYRDKIKPLMNELNIVVLNEYRIEKVVHSNLEKDQVNLLAIFGFPNEDTKKEFFSSPTYHDAKKLFNISTENFEKLIE